MLAGRPASLVATCDQWVRATHAGTAVDGADGELTLSWSTPPAPEPPGGGPCPSRGVATDRLCRIYRLRDDRVERLDVGATADGLDYARLSDPVTLIGPSPPAGAAGPDFEAPGSRPLVDGAGIAIDDDDRLYLADRATGVISVIDLWSRRLLRTIAVPTSAHPARLPLGLAPHGSTVYAVTQDPDQLLRLSATRGPTVLPWPRSVADLPAGSRPSRVAALPDGTPVVLFHDRAGDGWLLADGRPPRLVGPASDIVVDDHGAVVVAPCAPAGAALTRFVPAPARWVRSTPLNAHGYDGSGLVRTRDGRIGFFTAGGFRLAVIMAVEYVTDGTCVTYRLDSGVPSNRWGRILIEACVPAGTSCAVGSASSDDEHQAAIAHVAPEPASCVPANGATPPMQPVVLTTTPADADQPLHRRPDPVTPWWRPAPRYETFEAPITARPGRFLWVTVRLRGNGRRTPRVRELRVEHASHTLLRRLPAVYSSDDRPADFLRRYLSVVDGVLHDLDLRARSRDLLVDPHGTPIEALDWLASFVGLVLDDRWAEAARRQLVAEIVALYRRRGTVWALGRYLELFLAGDRAGDPTHRGAVPVIVEHFRLRGLGGPLLGGDPTASSRSVVGAGFRVGGAVGDLEGRPLDGGGEASSAFTTNAHRFTVLIPRPLTAEEEGAIRHVLEVERPAHTVVSLCTVEAGMRVGDGLHIGLSSIVGPTGAFEPALAGRSWIGRGTILGQPTTGVAVEAGRIGVTARVG